MPFADALTPLLGRLRARYVRTPIPAFLQWWWAELRACLPRRWQALLRGQEAQIWLSIEQDTVRIERVIAGQHEVLSERPLSAGPLDRAALDAVLGERAEALSRIILLPRSAVLLRRLTLPAAAIANVRALVGFEIDRQTPFRSDQVEFDSRLLPTDANAKLVPVELAVVPRESLEQHLAPLSEVAGLFDAVDFVVEGRRAGFNLLPPARRRVRSQGPLLLNSLLGLASLFLLLLAMAQLVENRHGAVAALQAEVDARRVQARATLQLRNGLDEAVAGANFLAEQKKQRPSILELLRLLTETLPDDTFIERMSFSGDTLSMTVQSGSAAKLVQLIQKTPGLSNPAVAGAIQPDPRSGRDRATLTAQYQRLTEADR